MACIVMVYIVTARLEEVNEGYQLEVENRRIGHREFKMYYKQQPKYAMFSRHIELVLLTSMP